MKLPSTSTPRWIIILGDLFISLLALVIAYLIRFDFYSDISVIKEELSIIQFSIPIFLLVKYLVFYTYQVHKGLVRFTSTEDLKRLFLAVLTSSLLFGVIGLFRYTLVDNYFLFPTSVVIIEFFVSVVILTGSRFAVKSLHYDKSKEKQKKVKRVLIYGAGVSGLITKRTIEKDTLNDYQIIGFLDDNKKLKGNRLEGRVIFHTSSFEKLVADEGVDELIIAIQKPDPSLKKDLIERALKLDIEVVTVPSVKSWINGEFSTKQIKKVRIEDLLGRKQIVLDEDQIKEDIQGKVVLITGAAGSIGSGMVRQLTRYGAKKLILLDQAESPLYDLQNELINNLDFHEFELVIGDIRSFHRMEKLFRTRKPEMVYHAAAYKHVPLMEENPSEAMLTNIKGTRNLVKLSDQYGVEKFVMISTDKAVNPTNVMGASKRVAELFAQAINLNSKTQFITTRFGNVLGSNGSVIPLFRKQIDQGGPITVTHKDVTRYFMTIPEACQLVLEAGTMGNGGEIFVFDMGESVKIMDLAKKMIRLSGLELGKDISIKVTGLRPGEKLYEELLSNAENTIETHHPQILKAILPQVDVDNIRKVEELITLFDNQDNYQIVGSMKAIVPEFKSNNSEFESLDNDKAS
ncbi:nucleoside-diphosphate sugar epimerase/dehydratase [Lishizhenia sp.]|uniref:polysaccharide biosynthesis protein n=1 Tax=Lishizhenia sp. TaxID=2497594 RepID=UPI00299EA085|nr:nucleoside-diphosphate sugar epimerase/dehydratase [Lishizhenia sp.]MDX1445532.1 nucleoside-diphosphate sugar epimerase/dehydratase [Lishizhenia sp.]